MNALVHIQRAHLLIGQSRFQMAEEQLRQALVLDPDHADAHALLSICLSTDRQRYDESLQEARAAIHADPTNPSGYRALAIVLQKQNQLADALSAVQEALRLDTYSEFTFGLQASILGQLDRWQEALESAEQGLAIDPDDESCGSMRVLALERLGRTEDALKEAQRMTERSPDSADAHASRGWALLHRGDARGAQEAFREALRLEPSNTWARRGMVDAINSNFLLYRVCFRVQAAISRLTESRQWVLIFGLWLAMQVLRSLAKTYPALGPYVFPLTIAYIGLCVLSWVLQPLFDTLLRFHPFGKFLLTRREIWASNALSVVILFTLLMPIPRLIAQDYPSALLYAVTLVSMTLPVSSIFRVRFGWPAYLMSGLTLAVVVLWATFWTFDGSNVKGLSGAALTLFLVGIFASGILANLLPKARASE